MKLIDPNSKFYRVKTIINSLKALYSLTPEQVDSFIKAYDVYEYDWFEGQAKKESDSLEYPEVKKNILNWYSVLNHLCALGQVEKMYIPPAVDPNKGVFDNQLLYEKQFCEWLGMKANDQVLELGCGRGRVAAHLASMTGANIIGINIDLGQLENAVSFAQKNDLSQQCQFLHKDFNDLPLPFSDNNFDCIYEVQALTYCKDIKKLFCELHRIIKPGGKLSLCEFVTLPSYNPNNPHHVEVLRRTKLAIGAIGAPTVSDYESALTNAGFKLVLSKNANPDDRQLPLIEKTDKYFDHLYGMIKFLNRIKVLPNHFILLFESLRKNTDILREADELKLMSMTYHYIAQRDQ